MIKNKFLTLILLALCVLLAACDPHRDYHTHFVDTDDVVAIELIEYDQNSLPNQKNIDNYDFEKESKIETLSQEEWNDFLLSIAEIFVVVYWRHPNSISGRSVKMIFDDGSFEVISENRLIVHYSETGEVLEYIGIVDDQKMFIGLIDEYFVC